MSEIDLEFVNYWAEVFEASRDPRQARLEREILEWTARLPEPKSLNKEWFMKVGRWKTPRYNDTRKSNPEKTIAKITRTAYETPDDLGKIRALTTLKGVGPAVASAILYYLEPDRYPLFDRHVRASLHEMGYWHRSVDDSTKEAWLDYVGITRELANQLGVKLRVLEKALLAYDKYGEPM